MNERFGISEIARVCHLSVAELKTDVLRWLFTKKDGARSVRISRMLGVGESY